MKRNVIREKSYAFSIRIVKLYQFLVKEKREFILSKQLLRCGTSIGANIEEAIAGISQNDFFFKLTIAHKECRETHYWIRLLKDTGYLTEEQHLSLIRDVEELLKIISSILITLSKENKKKNNNS